jgi:hypothetical protein
MCTKSHAIFNFCRWIRISSASWFYKKKKKTALTQGIRAAIPINQVVILELTKAQHFCVG